MFALAGTDVNTREERVEESSDWKAAENLIKAREVQGSSSALVLLVDKIL